MDNLNNNHTSIFSEPHFDWYEIPVEKYAPVIWFQNPGDTQTHYRGDGLMANLFHTKAEYYSAFLKMYGALGPENGKTYFTSLEDCEAFLEILKYLYELIVTDGKTWLDALYELFDELDSSLTQSSEEEESRMDYYLANAKTYATDASMLWKVVKIYTMPDGQQGIKIQRVV